MKPDNEDVGSVRACYGKAKSKEQLLQVPTDGRIRRKDGKIDTVYEGFERCPTSLLSDDVFETIRLCREWLAGFRPDGFEPSAMFVDAIMFIERLDNVAGCNAKY